MIEGLKIQIGSDELKKHLEARAEYHSQKVEFYKGQVKSLSDGGVGRTFHSNDPVGSLQGSVKEHANKMAYFKFMAEHLVPSEMYRISEHDLQQLEIYERYF